MNVSYGNQSQETRPKLRVHVTHSYIFATGGDGTGMYTQIILEFMPSMLFNAYSMFAVSLASQG